ncbi:MAG TPA: hypothetical protein VIB00_04795 [Pyrinomonadaceae bacterium]|jgi:hypothetical protein
MSDNYLWDKSGEPDPLIEELERELSSLRYQPRPLKIPAAHGFGRRRFFAPTLALAATIVIALVAATWTMLKTDKGDTSDNASAHNSSQHTQSTAIPSPHETSQQDSVKEPAPTPKEERPELVYSSAINKRRSVRGRQSDSVLRIRQRREAEIAKDQLMTALRLASTKLNLAQKRAQGTPSVIRNQHKSG